MNRRNFFGRFGKCLAAAALAAHIRFGELVPVAPGIQTFQTGGTLSLEACQAILSDFESRFGYQPKKLFLTPEEFGCVQAAFANCGDWRSARMAYHSAYYLGRTELVPKEGLGCLPLENCRIPSREAYQSSLDGETHFLAHYDGDNHQWYFGTRSYRERFGIEKYLSNAGQIKISA